MAYLKRKNKKNYNNIHMYTFIIINNNNDNNIKNCFAQLEVFYRSIGNTTWGRVF